MRVVQNQTVGTLVNVIPLHDTFEHTLSMRCVCKPIKEVHYLGPDVRGISIHHHEMC